MARQDPEQLTTEILDQLAAQAMSAMSAAHAPYSRFTVGAALLLEDGSVVSGSNVENASFGLTVCAERVAVFKAVGEGKRDFRALAVATPACPPSTPCGACLQVLTEFCTDLDIFLVDGNGQRRHETLSGLMPKPFGGPVTNEP